MANHSYRIHINETQSFNTVLDAAQPIRLIVANLVRNQGLAGQRQDGTAIVYKLFTSDTRRPLSSEQTLTQAGYSTGGDLYLADAQALWWLPPPSAPQTFSIFQTIISRVGSRTIWALVATAVVFILVGFAMANGINGSLPATDTATPGTTIAVSVQPTAVPPTLALQPTTSTTVIAAEAPSTPTLSPTPVDERVVKGVKPEYASYSPRIGIDSVSAYTRMRVEADAKSTPVSTLRNGDTVAVLSIEVAGWYRVRITYNGDGSQVGQEGWIERWLIDDELVPTPVPTSVPQPTRTPPPSPPQRFFEAQVIRTYPGSGQSGLQQSCVKGAVLSRSRRGVPGAIVYANNGVSNSPGLITNSQGYYTFCGLGDSSWSIVLTYVPNVRLRGGQSIGVIYVNGGPEQTAEVNFVEK